MTSTTLIEQWQISDWVTGPRSPSLLKPLQNRYVAIGKPDGCGAYDLVLIVPYEFNDQRREALKDAQRVVKCINYHDEMLDMIKTCLWALDGKGKPAAEAAAEARSLIKKMTL